MRFLLGIVVVGLVAFVGALAYAMRFDEIAALPAAPAASTFDRNVISKGELMTGMGDCEVCHTPYPNLKPDRQHRLAGGRDVRPREGIARSGNRGAECLHQRGKVASMAASAAIETRAVNASTFSSRIASPRIAWSTLPRASASATRNGIE